MTVSDLETITGMMNNDCPKGEVRLFYGLNTYWSYRQGKYVNPGTVRKGLVWIQWDTEGMASKILGKFRAVNSGFPSSVHVEPVNIGMVQSYLNMIKWVTV